MSEEPELPQRLPEASRRALRNSIVIPPAVTVALTIILSLIAKYGLARGVDLIPTLVFPLGAVVLIAYTFVFVAALRVRFRGTRLVLSCFGYIIGELIICTSLFYGTCLAVFLAE